MVSASEATFSLPAGRTIGKRIVYQVYDVTSQLRPGGNAVGAILAEAGMADGLGWLQTRYNFGPPPVRLLVQLEVEYTDGTRDSV